MRAFLRRLFSKRHDPPAAELSAALSYTTPIDPEKLRLIGELRAYQQVLAAMPVNERAGFVRYSSVAQEMIEARLMGGAGPGMASPDPERIREADAAVKRIHDRALGLREGGMTLSGQGAFGDIELALANVEWRREINLSWLEFSRWGIQQIILISRLYYIKNPLLRRAIDVCAVYVFGRGVEITSTDPAANDTLQEFFERNKKTFGPSAMIQAERTKYHDGNLFWAFFADTENTGEVNVREMDATEIQEIITDPEDGDKEILFKRVWRFKTFDPSTGATAIEDETRWYPSLEFAPEDGRTPPPGYGPTIGNSVVEWGVPILHRRCGSVARWNMGCPIVYPALEWAKTSKEYLEACLTIAQSHAQIAWTIMSKGGQAALQGIKAQLQTAVNAAPSNSLWDTNPPPVDASMFGAGPGTTITPVQSRGKGLDPSEVKEYRNMVGMVVGIPPTWLGDMETANLSTATTLDRPTELGFRGKQLQWEEDLATISKYVLAVAAGAVGGKLREAWDKRNAKVVNIREAKKRINARGMLVYDEASKPADDEVLVRVTFPAIREGDTPQIIGAIVNALTLDNKGGQIVGIDEREGVRLLFEALGVEDTEDILNKMYPLKASGVKNSPSYNPAYDPSRTKAPLPPPIGKALPPAGGLPQLPGGQQPVAVQPGAPTTQPGVQDKPQAASTEAFRRMIEAVRRFKRAS